MRWSIVRLIWFRELRDQLRDRRTLFMIAVLPLLLYPVLGFAVLQFAMGFQERQSVIGVVRGPLGSDDFPERALTHTGDGKPLYPPLIEGGKFTVEDPRLLALKALGKTVKARPSRLKVEFLADANPAPLEERRVDLIVSVSPDFYVALERGEEKEPAPRPQVRIHGRIDDDHSRQAAERLYPLLESWQRKLKDTRLARLGLSDTFDSPFVYVDDAFYKAAAPSSLFNLFVRIFPFMLVMWALAGALYPAVDLCAGEKERGTMETLLISPAAREEIVYGKFLTIWVFSAGTSFLNLISMGLTTWGFAKEIPTGALTVGTLFWCVVLVLPLSAFFSAISLALGAYARSSKEGQYYLMPLFLVTMPLVFLTLAPGVTLSPFYSLVPVTGVALLMQRLMTTASFEQVPWLYFIPVLAPIGLYSWIALRWAIDQFQREEVLFREAERIDIRLWLRRVFRDKEPTPTPGQALFLFCMLMFLRWLSLGVGGEFSRLTHTAVSLLAFVATPTLFMTIILNTRPAQALALRPPLLRELSVACVLALLLLPPLAGLAQTIFSEFPRLTDLLEERQPMVRELRELRELRDPLLVFGILAAICEELAFRGFILTGLLRRLRPRNAILLSSFLFALFHMNVFQFLPSFFLGVVLGLLTVRSKSVLPAMFFHALHNGLLITGMYIVNAAAAAEVPDLTGLWVFVIALCLVLGAATLWWLYRKPYVELERQTEQITRS
jgi:sodium transport system permease protein